MPSTQGGAEAAARLAVLAAAGVYIEPSTIGTQRSTSPPGRATRLDSGGTTQLRILASCSQRQHRRRLAGPRVEAIGYTIDPDVRPFPSFLNDEVCRLARLHAPGLGSFGRASTTPASKSDVVSEPADQHVRRSFNLMETDLVHLMVQTRISGASGLPLVNMEGSTVLHYDVGRANRSITMTSSIPRYRITKRRSARAAQRVMTFLVYLNDDYEAGETDFPRLEVSHKGRRGEGLYFINALRRGAGSTQLACRPPAGARREMDLVAIRP